MKKKSWFMPIAANVLSFFPPNKFLRLKYLQKECKNTSVVLGTNCFQSHYSTISFLGKHYKH